MNFDPTTIAMLASVFALGLLACWVLDKKLNPWLSKRRFAKFKHDFAAGKIAPRPPSDHFMQSGPNGFTVTRRKDNFLTVAVAWSDVTCVHVFKRDLFSTDQICMAFALPDDMEVEVSEDLDGWTALATNLPTYLPGCQPRDEWYGEVMLPPFEVKLAKIFSRESEPTRSPQPNPVLAT